MDDWFNVISSTSELSSDAARELHDTGFVVIPGPFGSERLAQIADAYDAAVSSAAADDKSIGGTTTRVHDFVNRGPDFDELYIYGPILAACCGVIDRPFKLSTMLARTVNPRAAAQAMHVDFRCEGDGWPMVGFIIMLDEFRSDNGSTRFVPGSHQWSTIPGDHMEDTSADHERQLLACGLGSTALPYGGRQDSEPAGAQLPAHPGRATLERDGLSC